MKKGFFRKTRKVVCLLVIASFSTWLPGGAAWGAGGDPKPLSAVPIPTPPNLGEFLKSDPVTGVPTHDARLAALRLGKALFWDMNVGGDGGQACASCHYRAGADPFDVRATNQINPRISGTFTGTSVVNGPNVTLNGGNYPFFQVLNASTAQLIQDGSGNAVFKDGNAITNNKDDVTGSQGVSFKTFLNTVLGNPLDNATSQNDGTFGHSRRVTGRNTPPAVNAVFNYANFWDGRANNIFNGSSPIGPIDPGAGIWVNLAGPLETPILQFQKVAIPNASLASQAVGPPNNNVEMSWDGRTFPQLGHKMLDNNLTPLGQQLVSKDDSLLGPLSNQWTALGNRGLNKTYAQLIKDAFQDKYWSGTGVNINGFFQMEANFSLFWGLSIMLYESTLVSDLTPLDCFLGNTNPACASVPALTMTANQQKGWGVFKSKCAMCHAGSELSDATVSNALANGLIEKGATQNGAAISDIGYANLGLRPQADDIGRGGIGGAFNPFASFAQEAIAQANGALPFSAPQAIFGGITATTPLAVNGSFKTPVLRNVALTAPYFHNGSILTLGDLVDFYSRGGNFANAFLAKELNSPVGVSASGNGDDKLALVDFLQNALTDPRVDAELAPFDHPELKIPDGSCDGTTVVGSNPPVACSNDNNTDPKLVRPATGGSLAGMPFDFDVFFASHGLETTTLDTLPKAELSNAPTGTTKETSINVTVTVQNGDSCNYTIDSISGVATVDQATGTATIPLGLADGTHTLTVTGVNSLTGHQQSAATQASATWTVKSALKTLEVAAPETMTKKSSQTITGSVEAGAKVTVSVNGGPAISATVTGTTWSCQVSLTKGSNDITVIATDTVGNTASKSATSKVLFADGCLSGTTSATLGDAVKALRMSVGLVTATADDKLHGDIDGNGSVDTGDALQILRHVAGLITL
jgi:cytochrome c peroxidase